MSLNQFTEEQLKEMSLIEMAFEILSSKKQPATFHEILDEITEALGLTEEEVRAKIAQFYTDINIDGRFLSLGENRWGLRIWYPVDQTEEEIATQAKPKKKKKAKKKVVEEEPELDEFDEEDDLDYDDLLDDDEEEADLDDDLDDEDEDFDEDDDFVEEDDDDDDLLEEDEEFEELEEDEEFDDDEEEEL